MIVDPAMLIWLDGGGNRVGRPNENLARGFMELFTLGVGNYSETDVRQAARALTGWRVDHAGDTAAFRDRAHDPSSETVLGTPRAYDATSLVDLFGALDSRKRGHHHAKEDQDRDQIAALEAQPVVQPGADRHHPQTQRVRGDPLDIRGGAAEVQLDRRNLDVADAGVQNGHEHADDGRQRKTHPGSTPTAGELGSL
jgi:uncharacterized protein (DUF1800 family)